MELDSALSSELENDLEYESEGISMNSILYYNLKWLIGDLYKLTDELNNNLYLELVNNFEYEIYCDLPF